MRKNVMEKTGFFGKVTASVTHELQNVLAIIRESSGLMEDIVLMDEGSPELGERLRKSLKTIKSQVDRGVQLTSGLNNFAHTSDHVEMHVNVVELIERLVSLTGRLAKLKGVHVSVAGGEKQPTLLTDPVLFQQIVFLCVECLVGIVPAETTLLISCTDKGTGMCVRFECGNLKSNAKDFQASVANSLPWKEIILAGQELKATVEVEEKSPGISLTFL